MSVASILEFCEANGTAMFEKSSILKRLRYKYEDDRLAAKLRDVIRETAGTPEGAPEPTLGSDALRTGLMMVMRNATTDSPWLLSDNPAAKYNDRSRSDCNLNLPLWQLIRASTAAPVYFPPEVVHIGEYEFIFVDGGLTTYNNPAFILFLMSTLSQYRVGRPAGEDRMQLDREIGTLMEGTGPLAGLFGDQPEQRLFT